MKIDWVICDFPDGSREIKATYDANDYFPSVNGVISELHVSNNQGVNIFVDERRVATIPPHRILSYGWNK